MEDSTVGARSVEAVRSVSMGDSAADARSVEAVASVSMGDSAVDARSVEAVASVSMGDVALTARSVEAVRSVSMDDIAANARSVCYWFGHRTPDRLPSDPTKVDSLSRCRTIPSAHSADLILRCCILLNPRHPSLERQDPPSLQE